MTETKKDPGTATLVVVLFLICLVTSLLLGLTNEVTAPFIEANNWKTTQEAMNAVLPADEYTDVTADYAGGDATVEAVYQAGDAGYVVQVSPPTSFSGNLTIMVGVDSSYACTGISVTSTGETSGLGSNAAPWPSPRTAATSTPSPAPPSPPAACARRSTPPSPWPRAWVKEVRT